MENSKKKIVLILLLISIVIFLSLLIIYINQKKITSNLIEKEVSKIDYNENVPKESIEPIYSLEQVEEVTISEFYKHKKEFKNIKSKGRLIIDSIDLNLPLFPGLNNVHLMAGAGEQLPENDIQPGGVGNYILASHKMSYSKNLGFSRLDKVREGDIIKVVIGENEYKYKVFLSKVVLNSETQYLDDEENRAIITLYTCEDLYNTRNSAKVVVQGELVR